ncbi:NAD(P)/FAD-dependent oxidoreductase [Ilumatobacter nonamiensis]|uniref:NAD(P)/FAD-dependent oxidoreductase n=1 Tax=Ilumatobacter nonamiensis TaxID=467093 RepID=UPI0003487D1B|nr:NAD(P)/FAD-dependent oxidoreductase [Ilumatobacter nonamiensis]
MTDRSSTDVLVVGGGPAGCAAAIRLAAVGHQVTVLESSTGDAPIGSGDLLVPAAVDELSELGVDIGAVGANPIDGTRLWRGERSVPVRWPHTRAGTSTGAVIRRSALNEALRARAADVGAEVRLGSRATTPSVERGFVRGAAIETTDGSADEIGCRFLIVADGANSRFGRGLGTHRDRRWPYAISANTYVTSGRSDDSWIETVLGPPDADGHPITGHGWVHPIGDGTLNVGVSMLSSYRYVHGVNIIKLLDAFASSVAERWGFDPGERLVEPVRRRTPLGGSVSPAMGPTFLVAGDAAAMANPFNGHGVRAALATGRTAADVLDEALTVGNSTTLQHYPALLEESLGQYHKVGRLTARFLGRPILLRTALTTGIRSEAAMGAALRIATNELRDGETGGAERAYRIAALIARFAPSW